MKKGRGCASCNHTGFRGRIGIFKILDVNEAMAKALRHRDVEGFNSAAKAQKSFIPLGRSALAYALQGLTSISEVMRICAMLDDEQPAVGEL